jgi:Xaa-Pro aminopeptidase
MRIHLRSILFGTAIASLIFFPGLSISLADDGKTTPQVSITVGPSKEEYRERRAALMKKVKEASATSAPLRGAMRRGAAGGAATPGSSPTVIVVVGEGEPGDDGKFRQENNFSYLTGVNEPNASLLLWPESGEETLYLPPRDRSQDRWVGARLGPGPEAASSTGIARVESSGAFLADLFKAIGDPRTGGRSQAGAVYLLEPTPRPNSITPAARLSKYLKDGAPTARFSDLAPIVHEMRKAKSDAEAALIQRAVDVTRDAHREVVRIIRPGIPEYRLEGAILGAFVSGGALRAGFPSIVGSGPNSTVLHYSKNDRIIEDGDLVVVDIGGEYKNYTADLTRTYPANGKFTPRQREVYQLVLDAQTAAANAFKPGVSTMGNLTQVVRDVFRNSPLRAKDENGVEQTMDHFFLHGLGHQLGMDVHDVGDNGRPMAVGEVFTIEPGIYISTESLGVRIEDDYRATKDGIDKLSKEIPVEVDAIERLIAEGRNGSGAPPARSSASAP